MCKKYVQFASVLFKMCWNSEVIENNTKNLKWSKFRSLIYPFGYYKHLALYSMQFHFPVTTDFLLWLFFLKVNLIFESNLFHMHQWSASRADRNSPSCTRTLQQRGCLHLLAKERLSYSLVPLRWELFFGASVSVVKLARKTITQCLPPLWEYIFFYIT